MCRLKARAWHREAGLGIEETSYDWSFSLGFYKREFSHTLHANWRKEGFVVFNIEIEGQFLASQDEFHLIKGFAGCIQRPEAAIGEKLAFLVEEIVKIGQLPGQAKNLPSANLDGNI